MAGPTVYSQNFFQKSAEKKSWKKYFTSLLLDMSDLGFETWTQRLISHHTIYWTRTTSVISFHDDCFVRHWYNCNSLRLLMQIHWSCLYFESLMLFSFLQRRCHPLTSCTKKIADQPCYNVIFLFQKDRTQILKKGMSVFTTY